VRLNHVALPVADAERSAAFYAEHFGFDRRLHDDEHLVMLGSPDGSLLALMPGRPWEADPGRLHFGFQLDSCEDVRAARRRCRAAGVEETEWQDDPGFTRVQVRDPDGWRVELFAY